MIFDILADASFPTRLETLTVQVRTRGYEGARDVSQDTWPGSINSRVRPELCGSPDQPPWTTLKLTKLSFRGKSLENNENNNSRKGGHPLITDYMPSRDLLSFNARKNPEPLSHFVITHLPKYLIMPVSHALAFMPHEGRVHVRFAHHYIPSAWHLFAQKTRCSCFKEILLRKTGPRKVKRFA